MPQQFAKRAIATLDYSVNWSAWLASGETISASQWTVDSGITASSPSFTGTQAVIWLSGGTVGADYTATNQITTSAGRIDSRSIHIDVSGQ